MSAPGAPRSPGRPEPIAIVGIGSTGVHAITEVRPTFRVAGEATR
jgi:hypothetical protein